VTLDWRPPTLETPRLVLRPATAADAPAVYLYASNPAVTRFTLFETHQAIDDSRWFVTDYVRSRYFNREPDPLAIVLKDDPLGRMIGALGAHWASQPNGTMELGYSLAEPYWGRGLTTEAARALTDHVFAEYAVERLQARVFFGNESSGRVLEKLGFRPEGVLRSLVFRRGRHWDIVMYSLLRADWERLETDQSRARSETGQAA
jgi:ribosomal-protein-alanine N-acetyltransferase